MNRSLQQKKKRQTLLLVVSLMTMSIYIIWRLVFTLPLDSGALAFAFGLALVVAEAMSAAESFVLYFQMNKNVIPELPDIPPEWFPEVDVLIATHNEEPELLYKTLNACTYMDYPDKRKVHIYLCDDANRPAMADLARRLKVGYFGLSNNKHAKAGNLNNALFKTHSPLVLTLDADMIPRSNFLLRTVPYFFLPRMKKDAQGRWVQRSPEEIDPKFKIGFIQTPQSFYNPDLFQYNLYSEERIPNEQDYFFRNVNVARNATNSPVYAGSNTLISREALMEVEGIASYTITEDFATGLRIQRKGYTCYATNEVLAHGLSPDTVKSLLSQRERWGRGGIQTLRHEKLLRDHSLPLGMRISNLVTWSHWWGFLRRAIFIFSPLVAVLFNLRIAEATIPQLLIFWFPASFIFGRTLRVLSKNIRNQHWSSVVDTIMFPYLIGPIFAETVGIRKKKFVVTEKRRNVNNRQTSLVFGLPHIFLLVSTVVALVITIRYTLQTGMLYNVLILFWLVINGQHLIYALFFMYGRTNLRGSERFIVRTPVEIQNGAKTIQATTADISETGLALLTNQPEYLPVGNPVLLTVRSGPYKAFLMGKVINIGQVGKQFRYSLLITDMDEKDRREYLQIVYDRENTMPKTLSAATSPLGDLNTNLVRRTRKYKSAGRQLPRMTLNLPFAFSDGRRGILQDFNYHYVKVTTDVPIDTGDELDIAFGPKIAFRLRLREEGLDDNYVYELADGEYVNAQSQSDSYIFEVINRASFIQDPLYQQALEQWIADSVNPAAREQPGAAMLAHNRAPRGNVEFSAD